MQFTGSLGVWSVKKLISLNYYIEPFIKIIKRNNFNSCIYVDPFCGSGLFQIDNNIFPGSPLVSLFNEQKFDKYYLSDNDENYVNSLRKRINLRFNTLDIDIKCCDCNERLLEIFDGATPSKWKNTAYLVFLDPYGFHLKWNTIEQILKSGAVDIIFTFMTSQINRNRKVKNSENRLNDLFGNREWQSLTSLDDFVNHYCHQIEKYGDLYDGYKTYKIGIYNFQGVRYDLIFATQSRGGGKVMNDLRKRIDPINTNLLNSAFKVSIGKNIDLDSFLE